MKTNISQARINQQTRNMIKQPLTYLKAMPLENDIYTWHFTIQGPQNTDFHQGLYHGQILLPFQYPFKPPDIVFMNKNGRFQTNTKICLTITQYHPEQWNSAWTIRTMLQAVMSLFSQNVQGIGYQEGSPQLRRHLAIRSHDYKCDKCGILKDLLKPREPMKDPEQKEKQQKEKKKEEQNDGSQGMATQKLEYATDLNLKKVQTEDNRMNGVRKPSLIAQKKVILKNEVKQELAKQINLQKKKQTKQQKQKKQEKVLKELEKNKEIIRKSWATDLPTPSHFNNYAHLGTVQWARVLNSQKWSSID